MKKSQIATIIVAAVNVVIFALAFIMPTVSFWLAIVVFISFVLLVILIKLFQKSLIKFLKEVHEKTNSSLACNKHCT